MLELFHKGGPIMWPILLTSIIALTVVLERLFFILREKVRRQPEVVERMLTAVERGDMDGAQKLGHGSRDFIARTLCYALSHEDKLNAVARAAGRELQRYNRGLSLLDPAITVAPLLGLLGTVTGMIRSFSILGAAELGTSIAVTKPLPQTTVTVAPKVALPGPSMQKPGCEIAETKVAVT